MDVSGSTHVSRVVQGILLAVLILSLLPGPVQGHLACNDGEAHDWYVVHACGHPHVGDTVDPGVGYRAEVAPDGYVRVHGDLPVAGETEVNLTFSTVYGPLGPVLSELAPVLNATDDVPVPNPLCDSVEPAPSPDETLPSLPEPGTRGIESDDLGEQDGVSPPIDREEICEGIQAWTEHLFTVKDEWADSVASTSSDGPPRTTGRRKLSQRSSSKQAFDERLNKVPSDEADDEERTAVGSIADTLPPKTPLPGGLSHAWDLPLVTVAASGLALLVAVVLYRRLSQDDVLDNDLRQTMIDLIRDDPGISAAALSETLDVHRSTVFYHARILAEVGMVVEAEVAGEKVFFDADDHDRRYRDLLATLNRDVQGGILRLLHDEPDACLTDVAEALDLSRRMANYHVEKLIDRGLVDDRRDGRYRRFSLRDGLSDVISDFA